MKRLIALSAIVACGALVSAATAFATTVYSNVQSPLPGNVASYAFEATQTSEIGNRVQFVGSARNLQTVTVVMSSWGCQTGHWTSGDCVTAAGATFMHPLTLNIRTVGPGNTPGAVLATKMTTFAMPYRPSADPLNCPMTPEKWYDAGTGTCFNGKAFTVTFNFAGDNVLLPATQAIISLTYNTSGFGYSPLGYSNPCNSTIAGCPYDSLNLGANDAGPSIGVDPDPDAGYAYAAYAFDYCDGSGPVNVFRLDTAWTTNPGCAGFKPAFQVDATSPARQTKQDVLADLNTVLLASTNKHDVAKLKEASKKLNESINPALWIDGDHLVAKTGEKVFQAEKEAVQKLAELIKDKNSGIADATLQGWINQLVMVDRGLAATAISDALATPGYDPKKTDEANKELAKGDADSAAGKSADAIEHYKNAWKKAMEAVKKL